MEKIKNCRRNCSNKVIKRSLCARSVVAQRENISLFPSHFDGDFQCLCFYIGWALSGQHVSLIDSLMSLIIDTATRDINDDDPLSSFDENTYDFRAWCKQIRSNICRNAYCVAFLRRFRLENFQRERLAGETKSATSANENVLENSSLTSEQSQWVIRFD